MSIWKCFISPSYNHKMNYYIFCDIFLKLLCTLLPIEQYMTRTFHGQGEQKNPERSKSKW